MTIDLNKTAYTRNEKAILYTSIWKNSLSTC